MPITKKHTETYYQRHKKEMAAYRREYCKKNPEYRKAIHKNYVKTHREQVIATQKRWRIKHSVKISAYRREHVHGVTPEQFNNMILSANNCCQICKKPFGNNRATTPHIDHNHKTGEIRGLLCKFCNSGIGMFMENITIMETAIKYIEKRTHHTNLFLTDRTP